MNFTAAGGTFTVNTLTGGDQRYSDLAALESGGFVAVWQDNTNAVRAQRLNSDGSFKDSEFLVNTPSDAVIQGKPAIAALEGGGFIVVWTNYLTGIVAQRYGTDGAKLSGPIRLTDADRAYQDKAAVTALKGGGFAVSWEGRVSQNGTANIFTQEVDGNGAKIGAETALTAFSSGFGATSTATAKLGDGHVVAWVDGSASPGVIRGQILSGGAETGEEFTIATVPSGGYISNPTLAALKDGGFVAAWSTIGSGKTYSVAAQRFDAAGKAVGAEVAVADITGTNITTLADVAALPDGGFAVSWQEYDYGAQDSDTFARAFAADGSAAGAEFRLNQASAGNQTHAEIAVGRDGKLMAIWTDMKPSASDTDIGAQPFSSDFSTAKLKFEGDFKSEVGVGGVRLLSYGSLLIHSDLKVTNATGEVTYTVSELDGIEILIRGQAGTVQSFTNTQLKADDVIIRHVGTKLSGSFNVTAKDAAGDVSEAKRFDVTAFNNRPTDIDAYGNSFAKDGAMLNFDGGEQSWFYYSTSKDGQGRTLDFRNGVTWSIVGGPDKDKVTIDAESGELKLRNAPDFEKPDDAGKDGDYDFTVRGTDNFGVSVDKNARIVVGKADFIFEVAEGAKAGTVLKTNNPLLSKFFASSKFQNVAEVKNGTFAFDKKTGAISVKDGLALDFEQKKSFNYNLGISLTPIDDAIAELESDVFGADFPSGWPISVQIKIKDVENETITGDARVNKLVGGKGNDKFYGLAGDDILDGGDGTNRLDGGKGNDTLTGGKGTDTYVVDSARDKIVEKAGKGLDVIESSISYSLTKNASIKGTVSKLTLTDEGSSLNIDATGNDLANELVGNRGMNRLDGGKSGDEMIGGAGGDFYIVDHEDDVVNELGAGSDSAPLDRAVDIVQSSVDFDFSSQTLGAVERLELMGRGDLDAKGSERAEVIVGNAGRNKITGYAGADDLYGGRDGKAVDKAADTFIFTRGIDSGPKSSDEIFDFGKGDRIDLSRMDANGAARGLGQFQLEDPKDAKDLKAFEFGEIRQQISGKNVVVTVNLDEKGVFEAVPVMRIVVRDSGFLDGSDFIL